MAWNELKPENDGLLINAPGEIRDNWAAIELGTDASLLHTNAKVSASANIECSKCKITGETEDDIVSLDASLNLQSSGEDINDIVLLPVTKVQGDLMYYSGSAYVRLAAGTDGYVLTTNGAAANPTWEDPKDTTLLSALILPWAGTIAGIPSGWLLCDGSQVSRGTYAALFAIVGVIYGVGDGVTTFNLPNLVDNLVVGAKQDDSGIPKSNITGSLLQTGGEATHVLTTAELPAHTHTLGSMGVTIYSSHFCATPGGTGLKLLKEGGGQFIAGVAYINNTGSDTGHNNIHPYKVSSYIIKT